MDFLNNFEVVGHTRHSLFNLRYDLQFKTCALFCSINFKQYEKPEKDLPANSEVLKALQEQEAPLRGVAGMAELQEDRAMTSN
jgi:hypothetical protein